MIGALVPVGAPKNGGGCFLKSRGSVSLFLFTFLAQREVMPMFVTWELLFLFAGFILALMTYIDNHNNKKK
jgi:hypothetical protein